MAVDRFTEIKESYSSGRITYDQYSYQAYEHITSVLFNSVLKGIDLYMPANLADAERERQKIANGLRMIKTSKTNAKGEFNSGETIQQRVIDLISSTQELKVLKTAANFLVQDQEMYSRFINDLVDLFHYILAALDRKLDPSLVEPALPSFMQNQQVNTVPHPVEAKSKSKSINFSELFTRHITHKEVEDNLKENSRKNMQYAHSVFLLLIGDKPINEIKQVDIRTCMDSYKKLPRKNMKPYNRMPLEQMVNLEYVPENHRITDKTAKEAYKVLKTAFTYALHYDFLDKSPMVPIKFNQSSKIKRGAYSIAQVRQLLVKVTEEKQVWKHWILRLAVYVGARAGEITQLRQQDIKQEAETGIHYLAITDTVEEDEDDDEDYYEGRIRVLKTENALRMIPIHASLINLGFLDFVKSCNGDLFPEVKSSKKVTSWFARFKVKVGMPTRNEYGLPLVFHSFRHSFVTQVRGSSTVSDALLQQVVGHKISEVGTTSTYTGRYPLSELVPVIKAITY